MAINTPQKLCDAIDTKSPNANSAEILSYIQNASVEDLNYQDKNRDNSTALILAVRQKDFKLVDALVKKGVNQNLFDNNEKTAQGYLTNYDDLATQIKMWQVLKGQGYKEEIAISSKENPDILSNPSQVKNPYNTHKYNDKKTSLIEASKMGDVNKVKSLLEKGENPNIQDSSGKTALMHAIEHADLYYVYDPKKENVINLLIEKTDLNIQDNKGHTALMHSIKKKDLDTTKNLIEQGADTDLVNKEGKTALKLAMDTKNPLLVWEVTGQVGKEAKTALANQQNDLRIINNLKGPNKNKDKTR